MSILTDIFTSTAGTLVKDVSEAVKPFVTTEGDKLKLAAEIEAKVLDFTDKIVTHADSYESELTKRLQADAQSDSWLAKNIRPMALIYLIAVYTLLALTDGNITYHAFVFAIKPQYVTAFQSFTEYFVCFYAGGRSLEKIANVVGSAIKR